MSPSGVRPRDVSVLLEPAGGASRFGQRVRFGVQPGLEHLAALGAEHAGVEEDFEVVRREFHLGFSVPKSTGFPRS